MGNAQLQIHIIHKIYGKLYIKEQIAIAVVKYEVLYFNW